VADEFGVAYQYQSARVNVRLINRTREPVSISDIKPRLASDKYVDAKPILIAPGSSQTIEVEVQTGNSIGRLAKYFDMYSDRDIEPIGSFAVRGFVDWVVTPDSITVDVGNVDTGKGIVRTVEIKERPGINLKLLKVLDENLHFSAKIEDSGRSVILTSKTDAPLGLFDEYITVSTTDANQPKIGIHVRGQFVSGVVASSNPVDFGLLRIGETSEQIVRLENLDGKRIQIGDIRAEGTPVEVVAEDCIPKSEACKNIRMRLPARDARGQIGGVVHVELLPSKRDYPVHFGMVVIGKDTQIRSFEEDLKAASEAEPAVSDLLKSAIRKPVAPLEMPKPEGNGPLLTWQAANENGVYGYEVYRGITATGPFSRVSEKFVERLDRTGLAGSIYRWRDTNAKSGVTYYYYVGIVFEDGRRREFTAPQKIVVK